MPVSNCGFKPTNIGSGFGSEICIYDYRGRAFVFAEFRQNLVRGGNRQPQIPKAGSNRRLVLWISEGVEKRDSDALCAARAYLPGQFLELFGRWRAENFAFGTQPFPDSEAQLFGHERKRGSRHPVVKMPPRLATD